MGSKAFTHKTAENLKPTDKPYKKGAGKGLYLYVTTTGNKLWRYDYTFQGKRKTVSLGSFPVVGLAEAAAKLLEYKKIIAQGLDPVVEKKRAKAEEEAQVAAKSQTFEVVAREWFAKKIVAKSLNYQHRVLVQLEKNVFPFIGNKQYTKLTRKDYINVLSKIEERGAHTIAHLVANHCSRIARYACAADIAEYDVTTGLGEFLTTVQTKHHAAIIDPVELGHLLRAIDDYNGEPTTRAALRLLPYVFVRSAELRGMEWSEVNLDDAIWTIPAARMKMKRIHVVPLARQVVNVLRSLYEYTGGKQLVFSSYHSKTRCLSHQTLRSALHRIGYSKEQVSVHGFRTTASTLLNEQGFNRDWIEMQLAHTEKNNVRDAYNRAEYLPERRKMMQDWADYLDSLRETQPPKVCR